jgi:hypothetical protein
MRLLITLLILTLCSTALTNIYGQDSTKVNSTAPPASRPIGVPIPKPKPIIKTNDTEEEPTTSEKIQNLIKKDNTTKLDGEPNLSWGEVAIEDLKMTTYAHDTSANEVLLLNYSEVSRGFYEGSYGVFYDYHYRIKIMEKSKYSGGEIELISDNYNYVIQIKAQTINYIDGATEKIKVKEILEDDQGGGETLFRFSFPEIRDGSVLEYKYRIFCTNPVLIENIFFQYMIPVVWSEFRLFKI